MKPNAVLRQWILSCPKIHSIQMILATKSQNLRKKAMAQLQTVDPPEMVAKVGSGDLQTTTPQAERRKMRKRTSVRTDTSRAGTKRIIMRTGAREAEIDEVALVQEEAERKVNLPTEKKNARSKDHPPMPHNQLPHPKNMKMKRDLVEDSEAPEVVEREVEGREVVEVSEEEVKEAAEIEEEADTLGHLAKIKNGNSGNISLATLREEVLATTERETVCMMISTSVPASVEAHLKIDAESIMKCIPCTALQEADKDHLLTKDTHQPCQAAEVVSQSNTLPTIATTNIMSTHPCSIHPATSLIPTFTVVDPECHLTNTTCVPNSIPEEALLLVEDLQQCVVVNVAHHSEEVAVDPQEKNDTETRAKLVKKSADP